MATKAKAPTVQIESISPKRAAELLATGANMRRLRLAWVKRLARAMLAGRWELNGETIKIDTDGRLIDGQHRLSACVMAKKALRTAVMYGSPPGATYVDIGGVRSAGQLIEARGHRRASVLAAASRVLWFYDGPGVTQQVNGHLAPDRGELADLVDDNPGLARSAQICRGAEHIVPPSLITFVHFVATRESGGDSDMPDLFVEGVATGEKMQVGDAPYTLRERMMFLRAKWGRGFKAAKLDTLYMIVRSWNAFAKGEELRSLRMPTKLREDGWSDDLFPRIVGAK